MEQHTKNNHYIPKVLIRRFSNASKERFYCVNGIIKKTDASKIFSAEGIYNDKIEKFLNKNNESKLKTILDEIEEAMKFKLCIALREPFTVPEWDCLVYNIEKNKNAVEILNSFFNRLNLKFHAMNTNHDNEEVEVAQKALLHISSLSNCNNIVFVKNNIDFCPFVLSSNIPVILPVGMSIIFATPISNDILMLHYCSENTLKEFIKQYPSKHAINVAMSSVYTERGHMICNFVCSNEKYSNFLLSSKNNT